jgi:hypothetical protein
MKNILLSIFVLAAAAFGASAATVSGKWSGTFSIAAASHGGPESPVGASLSLQQDANNNVTGTAGVAGGPQHAFTKGKIDGNKVTLEIQQTDMTVKFDLVLTGDSMTGEVNMTGGQGPSGKANLNVTRAK